MADEFKSLPTFLKHSSSTLVHNRQRRTMFICSLISLMAFTSVISVVACPNGRRSHTEIMNTNESLKDSTQQNNLGLDKLILSFLETAFTEDTSSDISGINSENSKKSVNLGFFDIENDIPSSSNRREYFRFGNTLIFVSFYLIF